MGSPVIVPEAAGSPPAASLRELSRFGADVAGPDGLLAGGLDRGLHRGGPLTGQVHRQPPELLLHAKGPPGRYDIATWAIWLRRLSPFYGRRCGESRA